MRREQCVSGRSVDRGTRRPGIELRNQHFGVPTLSDYGEGYMKGYDQREFPFDAAESKTLSMRGNSMRENREGPETPSPDGGVGRSEKAERLKSDMHVSGNSHDLIVPTKRANKVGQ